MTPTIGLTRKLLMVINWLSLPRTFTSAGSSPISSSASRKAVCSGVVSPSSHAPPGKEPVPCAIDPVCAACEKHMPLILEIGERNKYSRTFETMYLALQGFLHNHLNSGAFCRAAMSFWVIYSSVNSGIRKCTAKKKVLFYNSPRTGLPQ